MKKSMLKSFLFFFLSGFLTFPLSVDAAANATSTKPLEVVLSQSEKAGLAGIRNQENAPTEGGFVFYNRQFISATLGKNRQILLTFDDGPNPHTTPIILDILKKHNLKGIFFLVGMNVRKFPNIVKRIHEEGHTLGNHTFYHPNLTHFGDSRILWEIRATNDLIKQITGCTPRIFRPPYGALNQRVLNILKQENMSVMLWNVDPGDWRSRNMSRTVENLKRQLHLSQGGKGGVVLLHDTLISTANALEPFLAALTTQGLLPAPFENERQESSHRAFWAARSPVSMEWKKSVQEIGLPESLQRPYLRVLLGYADKKPLTALELLRAKKSGTLMQTLLCRNF